MKKRIFWKLIISFVCIIVFSIVTGVVIHSYIYHVLEKEIVQSNASSLKQLSLQFDSKVENAAIFFLSLSSDPNIIKYIREDFIGGVDITHIYNTFKILKTKKSADAADLFIYYLNSDRVVSSARMALVSELYFTAYYRASEFSYDDFKKYFGHAHVMSVKSFGSPYDIAILQSFPLNNLKNPNAFAVYKLDKLAMVEMLNNARYCDDAVVIILNREGEIVATTDIEYRLISHIDVNQLKDTANYFRKTINGMEYIFQAVRSDYSGCTFISIVPANLFWTKLDSIQSYSLLAGCIYILFGILMSILLSYRNYTPILTLVKDIRNKSINVPPYVFHNEIDYIRSIMNTAINERDQYKISRQRELILQAVQGIYPKSKNIFDEFKMLGIELLSDYFTVMILHVDSWGSNSVSENYRYGPSQLFNPIIKDALDTHYIGKYQIFTVSTDNNTCICVINLSEKYFENALEICHGIQHSLKVQMETICTIAYSSAHKGWEGLSKAMKEAGTALQYRIIYGAGSIVSYDELIEESEISYNFEALETIERLICMSIVMGNPSPKDVIQQIKNELFNGDIHSPEECKYYFYDMNKLLKKVADKLGLNKEVLYVLSFCETLPQFDAQLISILNKFRQLYMENNLQQENYQKEKDLCDQIIEFINQNYSNPNLCVSEIGKNFNLASSYYLSRRFKNVTGVSIFDFLTKVRIEKAKELLLQTDDSIEKIAEAVGFVSSAALIRVFKKMENVTPGTYRQIYKRI
ncbi:MAG TPA: helix-turn-helix transcriptional regulator [Clostridiaceae bacterium]|nr:helix-turn-helix transcriptional regulator [Clostridiaceae bacterium]